MSAGPVGLNPWYTALWIAWLAAFALIEGAALLSKTPGDTLTEHVRKWLALSSRTKWAGRIAMIALLAWLCVHFLVPQP